MNDPISDMLARIRNANLALLPTVVMPHSRMKESIAGILKREGYIFDFAVEGKLPKTIKLKLKYVGKKGVIEKGRDRGPETHQHARAAPVRRRH